MKSFPRQYTLPEKQDINKILQSVKQIEWNEMGSII